MELNTGSVSNLEAGPSDTIDNVKQKIEQTVGHNDQPVDGNRIVSDCMLTDSCLDDASCGHEITCRKQSLH